MQWCATFHVSSAHRPIKIAFFVNKLSFRGTEVATFDYAHYNETLLGNESIIINHDTQTNNEVRQKFVNRFGKEKFFDCATMQEIDQILLREQVDIFYSLKEGYRDSFISAVSKNAVHAVFPYAIDPHGNVYACVSQWLSEQFPQLNLPFVPHMITLPNSPENLRDELKIPDNAIVFGRHGGYETFDLPFVHEVVCKVARHRKDIYFIFLNTNKFCNLPNVIFLPATTDLLYKTKFINTGDAMLHARYRGETFGLACAEFSIKNKPVITWFNSRERSHIDILGNKGIYYTHADDLLHILYSFKKEPHKNWDAYSEKFSPELVMKKFDEVFIKPLIAGKK